MVNKELQHAYGSRIKANQTMKFGQLIGIPREIFKKKCKNEAGKLIPDRFLFYKNALN